MKAATGELNLTVITLIAIAAVIGFFWIMWPSIKGTVSSQWDEINCVKRDKNGKCTQYSNKNKIDSSKGFIINNYNISF